MPIREGRYSGGNEGITKLKTNVISAAAERKQCLFILFYFLLSEVCLAACSRGWVKHCGMTLLLNIFVLFCLGSRQIQRCSVCKRKRSEENRADFSTGNMLGSPRINVFWVRCHCLISRSLGSLKHKSVTLFAV